MCKDISKIIRFIKATPNAHIWRIKVHILNMNINVEIYACSAKLFIYDFVARPTKYIVRGLQMTNHAEVHWKMDRTR